MSAPLILSSSVGAAGITRTAYRRELQAEIGHYRLVLATSNAYEPRMLTIARLRGDDLPRSRFDGHYVYSPTLDEARRVITGSFDGATGTLALDEPFSSTLTNAELEITNTLPGTYYLDLKGANQCVNDALKRLLVWARIEFEGNGTRSYSLNDYADLDDDLISHIEDRYQGTTADPVEMSPYGWGVQQNGSDRVLVTDQSYAEGLGFTLVTVRRGDVWIRSGGSWGAGSGLNSESDAAAAPLKWVRIWGAVAAYRHLIEATDEDESLSEARRARRIARYEGSIRSYAGAMRQVVRNEFPQLAPRKRRAIQAVITNDYPIVGAAPGGA